MGSKKLNQGRERHILQLEDEWPSKNCGGGTEIARKGEAGSERRSYSSPVGVQILAKYLLQDKG